MTKKKQYDVMTGREVQLRPVGRPPKPMEDPKVTAWKLLKRKEYDKNHKAKIRAGKLGRKAKKNLADRRKDQFKKLVSGQMKQ